MKSRNRLRGALATAMIALAAALAVAAAPATKPAAGTTPAASARSAVNPDAMKALKDMGAFLRTLKAFQVTAEVTNEDVLDNGQKIQNVGTADILVQTPNHLRAEVVNDRSHRLILYDGKTFTLYGKRLNYYATVPAPPTLKELADTLESRYDVSVPLRDLFHWGSPGWTPNTVTSALDVGPSQVNGTSCEQYAFSEPEIDWQIWIQQGEYPLPRRLVITTKTDDARPQHTAVYTWNLAPSFNDAAFTFDPPAGAGKVVLAEYPDSGN